MLKSSQHKFDGRDHKLVERYEVTISQLTMDLFPFNVYLFFLSVTDGIFSQDLTTWETRVCYRKEELRTLHEHLGWTP